MTQRGSYAKGVAKRQEILETAVEVIGRNGLSGATVRELADAVGLSQNGLLHYFGSKDELYTEILRKRDELDRPVQPAGVTLDRVVAALVDTVRHNADTPGLVQLYARIVNEAAREDHPSHTYFHERYESIREGLSGLFELLHADGRLPDDADPDRLAVLTMATIDGLQTQWMYDERVNMAEHFEYLLHLMGVRWDDYSSQHP